MARSIRIEYEQAVYHVMARGNRRSEIYGHDGDRQLFLRTLGEVVERFQMQVHVYCLMSNHYHLIIETPLGNLSRGIGWLQNTYTIRYNKRHRKVGHLFQGRYKAILVEKDPYARQLISYIHLNPVRVGVNKGRMIPPERWEELKQYPWSSHRVYDGREKAPEWLSAEWKKYFGRKQGEQCREYRKVIREYFEREVESPWDSVRLGLILGGEAFVEKARELMKGKAGHEEIKWLANEEVLWRQQQLQQILSQEGDAKMQIWLRVRLGQERMIEVGRELGYPNGGAVSVMLKRLEKQFETDAKMREKKQNYEKQLKR